MKPSYHVQVLLREIEKRKGKNSRYSLRAFAMFLGLAPSTLSRILTNGQELSVSATKKIMKKLQLTEEEQVLFVASVAEEKKVRTLQSLARITGDAQKDFRFTLESIANLAMKKFSDGCIIHIHNQRQESIVHAKHKAGHFSGGNFNIMSAPMICHPILTPKDPLFINIRGKHDEILGHLNAKSLLCVPVMKGEETCGAITFLRSDDREDFTEDDLDSAQEFSSKTAYVCHLNSDL